MARRLTSTPSPRLAVDVGISEGPTQRQTQSPISNCDLGTSPLYYPVVSNSAAVPEFPSFSDPPDMSPPFPNDSGPRFQGPVHHTAFFMDSVDPLCTITHVYQSALYQPHETISEAHSVLNPSGLPYPSTVQPHSTVFPESIDAPLPEPSQVQPRLPPPSTPANFHGFGESSIADAAPHAPISYANRTADNLRTLYPCQYPKEDGTPCNAQVRGNKPFIRKHLREDHAFNGAGSDPVKCHWAACGKTMKRDSLPRHIVACHLQVKSYCVYCGTPLSRPDVQRSHKRSCIAWRQGGSRLDPDASCSSPR